MAKKYKTHTSTEVKERWKKANYKRFIISLRFDTDQESIDYIEQRKSNGENTTEIFRDLIKRGMEKTTE